MGNPVWMFQLNQIKTGNGEHTAKIDFNFAADSSEQLFVCQIWHRANMHGRLLTSKTLFIEIQIVP